MRARPCGAAKAETCGASASLPTSICSGETPSRIRAARIAPARRCDSVRERSEPVSRSVAAMAMFAEPPLRTSAAAWRTTVWPTALSSVRSKPN
jgi:hypothetical protein